MVTLLIDGAVILVLLTALGLLMQANDLLPSRAQILDTYRQRPRSANARYRARLRAARAVTDPNEAARLTGSLG